jgi:hypothetical protein
MKIKHVSLAIAAAFFLPTIARSEPPAPVTAAIFDFQSSGEKFAKKGPEVATLLNAQLSSATNVILVERQELEKLLGEQELGLSGTVTAESAAKVGALTGAKVLVTGRLFDEGDKIFLVAKIMGTETGRVYGETVTFGDLGTLDKAVGELAGKIQAVIEKHADTLVAKTEEPAVRLERLKKSVEGKKLPSVSVNISEQHIARASADPAAQTEMRLMLQQLGFEVTESKKKQADIEISGEAFSELAGRHGNLISCRSRVEIKAVKSATGKLLLADRQTDSGVDLAENVAGKSALQNAALKLLDRLVPKLAAE